MAMHSDRNGERDRRDERGQFDERYRERYGMRDPDDGDRERRFGRFGRWDEDRGRDDERMRYQGTGGQSGSQAGGMSDSRMSNDRMGDNMYREQTGYRGEDMYDRDRGGRYGGNRQNMEHDQRFGGQSGGQFSGQFGGGQQDWQRRSEWQGGQGGYGGGGQTDWGTGARQDYGRDYNRDSGRDYNRDSGRDSGRDRDRDFGGTLGHVDRSYGQQRGSQYGTSGPFGGGHRGKGPSGYMRGDERIREDVCDTLSDDDNVDATHIEITVKNGEVTLSGTVPDRRTKRMAEDCIEHVRGVKDVVNNLRVQDRQQEMSGQNRNGSQPQSVSSSPEKDQDHSKRPRA